VTLQIVADLVLVLAAEETVRAVEGEEHGEVAEEEADHRGRLEEESAGDVGWIAEPEDSDVGGEGRAQQQRSKERCHNANAAEYGGKGVHRSLLVPSRPFSSLRVPSPPGPRRVARRRISCAALPGDLKLSQEILNCPSTSASCQRVKNAVSTLSAVVTSSVRTLILGARM
jgi:hypothetical protein